MPGYAGASSQLVVGKPASEFGSANITYVQSLFLYQGKFCLDGRFFIPETAVLAYEF